MVVNIFVAGIIGISVTYWWFKSYEEGCAEMPDVLVQEMDPKTGVMNTSMGKGDHKLD